MSSNIPGDIVINILSRLPLHSLLKFRYVCKLWYNLISNDPNFILSVRSQTRIILLIFSTSRASGYPFNFQSINNEGFVETLSTPMTNESLDFPVRLLGSCNDVVIVCQGQNVFSYNTSTYECKQVLKSDCSFFNYIMSGLCYDPVTDDYKVIIASTGKCTFSRGPNLVKVGSLKRKRWKEVNAPSSFSKIWFREPFLNGGLVVNGYLHWLVETIGLFDDKNINYFVNHIIRFDAVKEKFSELPMPSAKSEQRVKTRSLIVGLWELDGCLSLASLNYKEYHIEIWVMKNYGFEESWANLFRFSQLQVMNPCYDRVRVLGFSKDNEVLMMVNRRKVVGYNLDKGLCRDIKTESNDYYISGFATYLQF